MWIDLYVAVALFVAIAAWLVTPRIQSYDPPGDITRGFCSVFAGALWPLILVGAAQIYAFRYVVRRLRPTFPETLAPAPLVVPREASVRI